MEEIDTESKLGSHSSHFSIGLGFPLGDFFKKELIGVGPSIKKVLTQSGPEGKA